MTKTLYEAYRIGKNGGERWIGTVSRAPDSTRDKVINRNVTSGQLITRKVPSGGSAFSRQTK